MYVFFTCCEIESNRYDWIFLLLFASCLTDTAIYSSPVSTTLFVLPASHSATTAEILFEFSRGPFFDKVEVAIRPGESPVQTFPVADSPTFRTVIVNTTGHTGIIWFEASASSSTEKSRVVTSNPITCRNVVNFIPGVHEECNTEGEAVWSNPKCWSSGALPTPSDVVFIPNTTVGVDLPNITIAGLYLTGETPTLRAMLTLSMITVGAWTNGRYSAELPNPFPKLVIRNQQNLNLAITVSGTASANEAPPFPLSGDIELTDVNSLRQVEAVTFTAGWPVHVQALVKVNHYVTFAGELTGNGGITGYGIKFKGGTCLCSCSILLCLFNVVFITHGPLMTYSAER